MSDKDTRGIRPVTIALVSTDNKTDLGVVCRGLRSATVYSTGRTLTAIKAANAGVVPREVEELTGLPEMLGGLVKTIGAPTFAGLLANPSDPKQVAEMAGAEWRFIDTLIINFYDFAREVGEAKGDLRVAKAMQDIGGPAAVTAAIKSFMTVVVLTDPTDYKEFAEQVEELEGTTLEFRLRMAQKAARYVRDFRAAVASFYDDVTPDQAYAFYQELHRG